jgi:predicted phosphodiesterase
MGSFASNSTAVVIVNGEDTTDLGTVRQNTDGTFERWDGSTWTPVTSSVLRRSHARLGLAADTGLSGQAQSAMAAMLLQKGVDAVLLAGDQNYGVPADIGRNNAVWSAFPNVVAAEGNHDIDYDGGAANRSRFPTPANAAVMPGNPGCYHTTVGDIDIVVLTSGRRTDWYQSVTGGVGVGSPMHNWFLGRIPQMQCRWRIVMFHIPEFSLVHGANQHDVSIGWPWHEYGVHLVITGHAHISYAAWKNGVCHLNASCAVRRDGRLNDRVRGAGAGVSVGWAREDTAAACVIDATSDKMVFEFFDMTGASMVAGDVESPIRSSAIVGLPLDENGRAATLPAHFKLQAVQVHGVPAGTEAHLRVADSPITQTVVADSRGAVFYPGDFTWGPRWLRPQDGLVVSASNGYAGYRTAVMSGQIIADAARPNASESPIDWTTVLQQMTNDLSNDDGANAAALNLTPYPLNT